MTWRITALLCVVVAYGLGWFLVAAGFKVLAGLLIVVPVLVLLIAGGNWLQHWLGIQRPSPKYAERAAHRDDASHDVEPPS